MSTETREAIVRFGFDQTEGRRAQRVADGQIVINAIGDVGKGRLALATAVSDHEAEVELTTRAVRGDREVNKINSFDDLVSALDLKPQKTGICVVLTLGITEHLPTRPGEKIHYGKSIATSSGRFVIDAGMNAVGKGSVVRVTSVKNRLIKVEKAVDVDPLTVQRAETILDFLDIVLERKNKGPRMEAVSTPAEKVVRLLEPLGFRNKSEKYSERIHLELDEGSALIFFNSDQSTEVPDGSIVAVRFAHKNEHRYIFDVRLPESYKGEEPPAFYLEEIPNFLGVEIKPTTAQRSSTFERTMARNREAEASLRRRGVFDGWQSGGADYGCAPRKAQAVRPTSRSQAKRQALARG